MLNLQNNRGLSGARRYLRWLFDTFTPTRVSKTDGGDEGNGEEPQEDKEELKIELTMMTDLLVEVLSHYGMKEVAGKDSNPDIMEFFKELGYDWVTDDSATAWCAAMLSYYAKKCGYEYNTTLGARDWLKMPVKILEPKTGHIVVFWRGSYNSWTGHVGIYIARDKNIIYTLGGNQGNQISIAGYPLDQVLGYRELRKLKDIKQ